jgi:peptide/nickel transport system permease protein
MAAIADFTSNAPSRAPRFSTFFKLIAQPKGAIGVTIVAFYAVLGLLGPILAPIDPLRQNFAATLQSPSMAHWFGTDELGRDLFSRILAGAPTSLGIGIGSVSFAFAIGVPLGLVAAWRRGLFDTLVMRGVDLMLSFPDIVLALAIVAILGPNTRSVILAVGTVTVPVFVRTSRAVALSTIAEPFVDGSIALGCTPARVVFRHVFPNIAGILLTLASLLFASALLSASGLGFLGAGVQPPTPEWGTMLGESRAYLRPHPLIATFPGLFLAFSALGFNLLGEALRTIYDPAASTISRRHLLNWPRRKTAPSAAASRSHSGGTADAALKAERLEVSYFTENRPLPVVRGVDLMLRPGRTLAVVGESGSGKSTLLRALATLLPRDKAGVTGGRIVIGQRDLADLKSSAIRDIRRREIGIVFQDPSSALNPVMTVGAQLIEAISAGSRMSRSNARRRAIELLGDVQISDPQKRLDTYPHQFSGGMKQRIVIAIALAQSPSILLADEPTSALDITIQQQILTLLREMRQKREMAMMLVTHDLGLVARHADDVAVMYAGQIVETGSAEDVLGSPRHPYTRALRLSTPKLRNTSGSRYLPAIAGEPPLMRENSIGCRFAPRCEWRKELDRCLKEEPVLQLVAGRAVACHRSEDAE